MSVTSFRLNRRLSVKSLIAMLLLSGVLLIGCGSGSGPEGSAAGVVFDESGNLVRNARVYYDRDDNSADDKETRSSTTGSYTLQHLPKGNIILRTEVSVGSTRYYGQNVAQINQGETARNVNIVVYPDSTIGGIKGVVQDRYGNVIEGARVFARQNDGSTLSSGVAVTNQYGEYKLSGLRDGQVYALVTNALGFGTDSDTVTIEAGQNLTYNFMLPNPTDPAIVAPADFSAQAFTSPTDVTRSAKVKAAVENVKRLMYPKNAARTKSKTTRATALGNIIEMDLYWTRPAFSDLLGYGIYRGATAGSLVNVGFLRDPLAEVYADANADLIEGNTYVYAATSLNTSYNNGYGESGFSNTWSVLALGDLVDQGVTTSPLTFHWSPATGATNYAVYVFDNYPTFYQSARWTNFSSPVTGTSVAYGGSSLVSGNTYYYMIVGLADYDTPTASWNSNTFSSVYSFVAP